jgi:collagen type I alpha
MSGTTITFVGTVSPDWNNAGNWTPATIPNAATVDVLVPPTLGVVGTTTATGPIIAAGTIGTPFSGTPVTSGGSIDTVGTLTLDGAAHMIVGGNADIGNTSGLGGTLIATSIVNASTNGGGGLVGGPAALITAPTLTNAAGAIVGGGGTFNIASFINNGEIQGDGGNFALGPLVITGGSITGTGSLTVESDTANSELDLGSTTTQNIDVTANAGLTALLAINTPSFGGTLDLMGTAVPHLDIFLQGQTNITGVTLSPNFGTLVVTAGTAVADTIAISPNGTIIPTVVTSTRAGYGEIAIVCYGRGTRIATTDGEALIEDLAPGDAVITADGRTEKVVWIGRRRVDCRRHPEPKQVWPVRIKAGAFGPALPRRDLLVSPQHGIHAEGVLIPAKYLINGSTVVQEPVEAVEYFHLELACHDIVLAEGLPAETYLDVGDRAAFENADGAVVLHPDFSRWAWDARACAEIKVTGPEFEAVRSRLSQRATAIEPAPMAAAG